ncbi:hypothetical protein [Paenibacillus illinoisensis]
MKRITNATIIYDRVNQSVLLVALILDESEGRGQMVSRGGG